MRGSLPSTSGMFRGWLKRWGGLACVSALVLSGSACTRKFFRERTDRDVIGVMTQKNQFEQWGIENWHVYPDPRARFADPMNPDRPQKPPDDYAAEVLSPNPQRGKKVGTGTYEGSGWLRYLEMWDEHNRKVTASETQAVTAQTPANPTEEPKTEFGMEGAVQQVAYNEPTNTQTIPGTKLEADGTVSTYDPQDSFNQALLSQQKTYLLTIDQANELALFNSRDFQDRREDLYGAALPVTLERFAFASQLFGTAQAIREVTGRERPEGKGNRWRLNTAGGFTKLFPSGATLLLQFANRLVIELNSRRPEIGISTLSLSIVQPLLQGGGFAVTLEPLTQAERTLLYAIRSYSRFRKLFYVYIAGGGDIFNSPFSLTGLSLRGVGPTLSARGIGFLPTLLASSQVRNETDNVAKLEEYLEQFRGFAEGSDVSRLQVDQVEQQLLQSRNSLLTRRLTFANNLDQFKLQLGIPTQVPLELEDKPLQPVEDQLTRFNQLRDAFNLTRRQADSFIESTRLGGMTIGSSALGALPIELPLRTFLRGLFTESDAVTDTEFRTNFPPRWQVWEKRTTQEVKDEVLRLRESERVLLAQKARLERDGQPLPTELTDGLITTRREIYLGQFENALRIYESQPWKQLGAAAALKDQATTYREAISLFTLVLTEARDERLEKIRKSWPSLPPVCVNGVDVVRESFDKSQDVACQTARENRLELMNARAQLVDAWRQIAVQANGLLGVLDVQYQLETSTPSNGNIPLAIGGSRTRHQLIINGELPLVRRLERNNYRTALIGFQRQRRLVQATEDFILNDVRADLRNLRVLAENYKIQQRQVDLAYALVENSLDVFQAPPDPRSVGGGNTAGNAAALTQQLLSAQSSLVRAQNDLYDIWTRYLIARMQLYRDLELLPLDPRGVWNDEISYQCDAECIGPPKPKLESPERDTEPSRLPEPDLSVPLLPESNRPKP